MKRVLLPILIPIALLVLAIPLAAQEKSSQPAPNPLVKILQSKGIITEQEAATLSASLSPAETELQLAKLLLAKGIINQQEYNQTISALDGSSATQLVPIAEH